MLLGEFACTDCHRFGEHGGLGSGPDLTGYGSHEWLVGMIGNPLSDWFYPGERNDRMPSFAPAAGHPEMNLLSPTELDLLVNWLRGEWYEAPTSASAESSPPNRARS